MNPYAQNNPYIMQAQGLDQQGLNPVFQNIANQQANQNAMIAQQNQLVNQASGVGGGGAGMNALAMAAALRNKQPQTGASLADRAANYFGTQQSPEMKAEISQLGSNTWNPMSDYYTGKNGWGNYGE